MGKSETDMAASYESSSAARELQGFFRTIRHNFGLIATVVVVVVGLNILYNLLLADRTYSAEATLVTTNQQEAGGLLSTLTQLGDVGTNLLTPTLGLSSDAQLCGHVLRSYRVRSRLVKKYDLQEILDAKNDQQAVEKLGEYIDITVDMPNIVRIRSKLPAGPILLPGEQNEQIRTMVADVVQTQIEALRATLNEFQISSAKRRRVFLEEKKREVKRQLHEAEIALSHWQAENEMIAVEQVAELVSKQLVDLHSDIVEAQISHKAAARQIQEARRLAGVEPDTIMATEQRVADPAITELRNRMVELQQKLATARFVERKKPQHPDVQRLEVELESARDELAQAERKRLRLAQQTTQANPVKEAIREKLAVLNVTREAEQARMIGYQQALEKAQDRVGGLSQKQLEYGQLLRDLKVREKLYEAMVQQYETALIAEKADEPNFHVLDSPVVPYSYSTPKPLASAAIALFFALLIGVIAAWLRGPQISGDVREDEEEGHGLH